MKKLTIAFDVNGTLTRKELRDLFQALDPKKCQRIVWSTVGINYCKNFCKQHNLEPDEIIEKYSKPVDITIDDNPSFAQAASQVLGVM